ncbi:MAG: DUF1499 domain-containing protein [Proteobacteria bacterium]|nr:DUF1499 domain-containing protein [Pseudomonadota bacterium]MBU1715108.1 DUF1499 domain-containing protein [Pseudomonadota bacterium]
MKTIHIILSICTVVGMVLPVNFRTIAGAAEDREPVADALAKCPKKPNCVCSEDKDDAKHYIEPLIIPKEITVDLLPLLKEIIQEMEGKMQAETDRYLAATFKSSIFKFVDDLEIRIDSPRRVIHIRSAARVGYSDFGVNRKRTKLLKKFFNNKIAADIQTGNTPPTNSAQ